MKITKSQLKELIREQGAALKEYGGSGKYGFDPGAAPPEEYGRVLMEFLADIDARLTALERDKLEEHRGTNNENHKETT